MASSDIVSVIKFISISSQLSDGEIQTFVSRLWRTVGRDRILQFICTSAPCFPANQRYVNILPTASSVASAIIADRDSDDQRCEIFPIQITDLPSCLLGEIASNLEPMEYIAFSKTNRKIFVDSNSPNRFQTLTLNPNDDYSGLRLQNFPQIKYLRFQSWRIIEFRRHNGHLFGGNNQLRSLSIDLGDSNHFNMESFINDQSPCFPSIHSLDLQDGLGFGCQFECVPFFQILSKFTGLTSLRLTDIDIAGSIKNEDLRVLCPAVSELSLYDVDPIEPFLASWGSKLKTLLTHIWTFMRP